MTRTAAPLLLLAAAGASTLSAQYTVRYSCANDGKYAVRFNGGRQHYCWDRVYFTDKTAPPHVVEHFERIKREMEDVRIRLSEGANKRAGKGFSRSSPFSLPSGPAAPVVASEKPAAAPVARALFEGVTAGLSADDVVTKLGEPHGRLAGLDESAAESWTYLVEGGGYAKIRLAQGAVTAVVLPK